MTITNQVHFTLKSSNEKIGPIPATVTSADSCPPSCPFNGDACYAGTGPVSWHWAKVSKGERGGSFADACANISSLPAGQLWRHNVAGDLPGVGETIDAVALGELVRANMGRRGFTYTHKTVYADNIQWIRHANNWGFTINLSGNDMVHADELANLNAGPVVCVLPIDAPAKQTTPGGRTVIKCPATYKPGVNCDNCQLCQKADRSTIVGFPAHGVRAKSADTIARRVINIALAA